MIAHTEPNESETDMATTDLPPGVHPVLASKILDEAARLRDRAREIMRESAPPMAGMDRTQAFADLLAEAWKQECGILADRLGDAAHILEQAVHGPSPTRDLVNWRRG